MELAGSDDDEGNEGVNNPVDEFGDEMLMTMHGNDEVEDADGVMERAKNIDQVGLSSPINSCPQRWLLLAFSFFRLQATSCVV